jgi:hypothetical protein
MASILEQPVEKARGLCRSEESNGKMNFYEVYQYSNSILSFNSTCVLRSENRHFVVVLTWSLGRMCATDWILKYTPTASRLIQTTDTIHKRLTLDEQCLLGIMRHLMCFQRRNFCLSSGATQQLDVISDLEAQKVSKNKLLGLEPSKLM